MNHSKNKLKFFQLFALIFIAILLLSLFFAVDGFNLANILSWIPDNQFIAIFALMLLFALKSLSIVFPILVIELAVGYLFSAPAALIINILGGILTILIPYWLATKISLCSLEEVLNRFPKLSPFYQSFKNDEFFFCFFLRIVGCLPMDLISILMGTLHIPFFTYFFSSLAGILPSIVAVTMLGESLTNPTSPQFLLAIGLNVFLSISAILIHYRIKRRRFSSFKP